MERRGVSLCLSLSQARRIDILDNTHWLILVKPSSKPALLAHARTLNIYINSEFLYASYDTCPTLIKVRADA